MSTEIQVKGFWVKYYGDRSAGIFDAIWEITGEFHFESENEFTLFKEKIREAFEYCSDTPIEVESFEDLPKEF